MYYNNHHYIHFIIHVCVYVTASVGVPDCSTPVLKTGKSLSI